jgi:diacylglycerol O-acyltransferase
MRYVHASDRLTAEDAGFLYLETKEMPLHIGSVSILDSELDLPSYIGFIESKLPLIPRYRQRIVFPPYNLGHPTWEDAPEFDISDHVHEARLKRGTLAELQELAGRIFSEIMDRNKPLWDLTLVHGLKGGRSAFISRVHHCLVDGVSGVGIINVMLAPDATPQAPSAVRKFHPRPLPGPAAVLTDALLSSYSEMLDRILSAQTAALNLAQAVVQEDAIRGLSRLAGMGPELLSPVDLLPFNKPCAGPRKVAWTEIPISEVKAIREACGGTLNDVVLTIVTTAVRRYTELNGQRVDGRALRLMVPVNLRRDAKDNGLGNRVSMLPVTIPLDIRDPVKLLDAVRTRTEAFKSGRIGDFVHLAATWIGTTPAPLQALLGPLASVLPVPPFNMVCTNVPGPQSRLYLLGREMVTFYPYVPIGNQMGMNCAIQSYNGKLYFGFTGAVEAVPDLDRLRDFLDDAFAELRATAGGRTEQGKTVPVLTKRGRKPTKRPRIPPQTKARVGVVNR